MKPLFKALITGAIVGTVAGMATTGFNYLGAIAGAVAAVVLSFVVK